MIGGDDPSKPTVLQQHLMAGLTNTCVDIVTPNGLERCKGNNKLEAM